MIGAALAERARDPLEVAEVIAALVAAPAGTRPLRTAVPSGSPVDSINDAVAPIQRTTLEFFGLSAFLAKLPAPV